MKKIRVVALIIGLSAMLLAAGCGDKELLSARVVRDDARTGGSLSFVYDSNRREIYVGGEDEVVQYSTEEGREGCRVGLKVIAPDENLDVSTARLSMNGVNYSSGDFLEEIDGQKQRFFNIYPVVSEKDKEVCFAVCWQDGTKEQEYKLIVLEGTRFMTKDGKVEGGEEE